MTSTRKPHTQQTKSRIAIGNTGKVFPKERCEAIANGKKNATSLSDLEKAEFIRIVSLGYVPTQECQRRLGIKRKRFFRFLKEFDLQQPITFLPSDLSEEDSEKLLIAAYKGVHFKEMASEFKRDVKQIWNIIKKFEQRYNFKYYYTRKVSQKETLPEKIIRETLETLGVEHTPQFGFKGFLMDFHISNTTLFIEVQGDFWHANPLTFPNGPLFYVQKDNVRRDNIKRRIAKDNGYWVWYIWEHDIHNNFEKVRTDIIERVKRALDHHRLVLST